VLDFMVGQIAIVIVNHSLAKKAFVVLLLSIAIIVYFAILVFKFKFSKGVLIPSSLSFG
tara:strand:+ start:743 stop:919 length:177 start_codon:yes stop_codon:yes gene_type:complete